MNELVLRLRDRARSRRDDKTRRHATSNLKRNAPAIVVAVAVFAIAQDTELRNVVVQTLADAFLQVTVFVAATLAAACAFERIVGKELGDAIKACGKWRIPIAACLGALPGCGGAIMIVTQFVRGGISFGALAAALISTMGDAAFLLVVGKPAVGIAVAIMGIAVGSISGVLIDAIHGEDFMRPRRHDDDHNPPRYEPDDEPRKAAPAIRNLVVNAWTALVILGAIPAVAVAAQVDLAQLAVAASLAPETPHILAATGAILAVAAWIVAGGGSSPLQSKNPRQFTHISIAERVSRDAGFVTFWAFCGFLIFELGNKLFDGGLHALFEIRPALTPLLAVAVGLLPGCGPQVVITSLYLNDAIPLSAQIGNAVSNDGDALFPAIALAPKAAALATLYSTIPALIVAYGWYWRFE